MKFKTFVLMAIIAIGSLFTASCSSDQEITDAAADANLVDEAKGFLTGDIVLSTKATMNGVDKTLLESGCPTKFGFEWSQEDPRTFKVSLLGFTVGAMGMVINYQCDVQTMVLNSWEQKEHSGAGWIKFKGSDGSCWGQKEDGSDFDGDGSAEGSVVKGSWVQGYYNVYTHQIEFQVYYNMMNVASNCFLQTIDKSRTANYVAEKEQYEADLAAYKLAHGYK